MKLTVRMLLFSFAGALACTSPYQIPNPENKVTQPEQDSVYQFEILSAQEKVTPQMGKQYYWYYGDSILNTDGGYQGSLLHGPYAVISKQKVLGEQGRFEYGLKEGEWRTWFEGGVLKSVENWQQGQKHGEFKTFYNDGRPEQIGSFSKDRMDGTWAYYNQEGEVLKVQKYKDGQIVIESDVAAKEVEASKSKSAPSKQNENIQTPEKTLLKEQKALEKEQKKAIKKQERERAKLEKEQKKKTSNDNYSDQEVDQLYQKEGKKKKEKKNKKSNDQPNSK